MLKKKHSTYFRQCFFPVQYIIINSIVIQKYFEIFNCTNLELSNFDPSLTWYLNLIYNRKRGDCIRLFINMIWKPRNMISCPAMEKGVKEEFFYP